MNFSAIFRICLFVLISATQVKCVFEIINLLRESVAGRPEFHQKQNWPFDPNVGLKRRVDFEKLNGYRSMGLVERLGLGEDGQQDERKVQQAIRDQGVPITGKRRR